MANNVRLRRIEALYATLPKVECKGLCWSSCYTGIQLSTPEMHQIRKRKGFTFKGTQINERCPLLDVVTHRCTVYDIRPMVCRLWGLTERMKCPHGCQPERVLSNLEEMQIINEVMFIGGDYTESEYRQNLVWMEDPEMFAALREYNYSDGRTEAKRKLAAAVVRYQEREMQQAESGSG